MNLLWVNVETCSVWHRLFWANILAFIHRHECDNAGIMWIFKSLMLICETCLVLQHRWAPWRGQSWRWLWLQNSWAWAGLVSDQEYTYPVLIWCKPLRVWQAHRSRCQLNKVITWRAASETDNFLFTCREPLLFDRWTILPLVVTVKHFNNSDINIPSPAWSSLTHLHHRVGTRAAAQCGWHQQDPCGES